MKNNLFNESLLKVSLLLISITLFLVYSCKKDTGKNSDVEFIQMAKEWFSDKPNFSYIPSWDKANVTHLNGHNFVILPSNMSLSSDEIIINSYLAVDISENEIQGNLIELFRTKDSEGDFFK